MTTMDCKWIGAAGLVAGIQAPTFHNHEVMETLGVGFKYFLFSPLFGEDSHFD